MEERQASLTTRTGKETAVCDFRDVIPTCTDAHAETLLSSVQFASDFQNHLDDARVQKLDERVGTEAVLISHGECLAIAPGSESPFRGVPDWMRISGAEGTLRGGA